MPLSARSDGTYRARAVERSFPRHADPYAAAAASPRHATAAATGLFGPPGSYAPAGARAGAFPAAPLPSPGRAYAPQPQVLFAAGRYGVYNGSTASVYNGSNTARFGDSQIELC
jgi:hypothetical protein